MSCRFGMAGMGLQLVLYVRNHFFISLLSHDVVKGMLVGWYCSQFIYVRIKFPVHCYSVLGRKLQSSLGAGIGRSLSKKI
jgi:hypothetical protein